MNFLKASFVAIITVFLMLVGFEFDIFKFQKAEVNSTLSEETQKIYAITFANLPDEEKQKYISKEDLYEYGGYITPKSYTENFSVKDDKPLSNNIEELQSKVRELSEKNAILAQDNIDISEKNLDFITKISQMKNSIEDEKNEILADNERKLNELEAQHLENIQILTKRLNEAQADMIESSKGYEKKIIDLENLINDTKLSDEKEIMALVNEFGHFRQVAEANFTDLKAKNNELNTQITQKNIRISELENNISKNTDESKKYIEILKNELTQSKNDMQNIKFSYDKELERIKDGFEMQKLTLEDELSKKSNEILDLKSAIDANQTAFQNSVFELNELKRNLNNQSLTVKDYSGQNLELNASLTTLKKSYDELKDKNTKIEQELRSSRDIIEKFKKEVSSNFSQISKLESQNNDKNASIISLNIKLNNAINELGNSQNKLKILNENLNKKNKIISEANQTINSYKIRLNKADDSLNKLKNTIEAKNENIRNLENNISILKSELSARQSENEIQKRTLKIDMQNYEILRQQIAMLEKEITNKGAIKYMQTLQNELNLAKTSLAESNKTIQQLNLKIAQLNSKSFKNDINAQIAELQKDIEQNLNKQDELEDENINLKMILQAQTKPETPTKLVLISSITCNDMDANSKISVMCKNRVSEFLQRFNSNYIYEIVPIVDKRNFVLPQNVTQNIKKDDLGRLNNYVNYGVGKERSKVVEQLLRDEFGDFARISFSSDVIIKDNIRGFVIKVYR
ncbi:hypothetical protein KDD93_05695 [Campylobacter sp. faydin G-24]|uniref:Vesicular transport factor Uso1p n=1 Tax=Campylobacter anatolicus TaxID=2829105 RepID=A0ABS5HIG8_9BACT|nr:hypothetical protein [Campylobacter anatolicus]MBR8464065.1 hypothetical protein [Campylobacter anatolicus]